MKLSFCRRGLCSGLVTPSLLAALATPVAALAAPAQTISFNIEAGPLHASLMTFAAQSRRQLLYSPQLVANHQAPAVHGQLSAESALKQLLSGSELIARSTGPNTFVLRARAKAPPPKQNPTKPVAASEPDGLAELNASTAIDAATPGRIVPGAAHMVDEVVITGTLIRGANAPTSPIVIFDREEIDRAGHATVADMLSALPQNFGGSGSPDTSLVSSDTRPTNDTVATGVNLRGLGTQSTLVLVNGRRMAGAGLRGDFADVSAIPTAAIQRVDVLLDGASALYGSDAVGGVVNIILRRDFEGFETRSRVGLATQGGAEEAQFAQTYGATWNSGSLLVAYEFHRRTRVAGSQRAYTATTDLRAFGGEDHRLVFGHPGNILNFDAATNSYASAYAIPTGQNGRDLKPSDFLAGQTNLLNQRADADLYPEQDRHSAYFNISQELGERVRFSADARFSRREIELRRPASIVVFNVTRANPFFVSPNGSTSHTIGYSFVDEIGPALTTGSSESLGLSAGLDLDLGRDWRGEIYVSHASETGRRQAVNLANTRFLNEALGVIPDDPATDYIAARDGYFNPFGDTGANSTAVLSFIGSGYNRTVSASTVDAIEAKVDGTLLHLPGGDLKAALGVQFRRESFEPRGVSQISRATPTSVGERTYERDVAAAFLEVRLPLVGPDNPQPWAKALEASIAGRIERYDGFGETANPKIGLLWAPTSTVRLRASYGTSFRAPNLTEVNDIESISPTFLPNGPTQSLVIIQSGGNRDLEPEEATSFTAGVDYTSQALPNLTLSASWFDIKFSRQIGQPVVGDTANALSNPAYAPFVRRLNATNPTDLAFVKALIARSTNAQIGLFAPESFGAVVDSRFVNSAEVRVRGIDLLAAYHHDFGADRLDLTGSLSYLVDFKRRFTPSAGPAQLLDTPGQPVDLRGRLSGTWTRDALSVMAAANYVDNYHDRLGQEIDAWTTVDVQLRWSPNTDSGLRNGLTLALNVQNLFDADPPFYDSTAGIGYDAANADPLGRFISLQLTKRW
ncbi:TonB-dependent receptor [Phenylobacterium sp. Root700]|uniref:TonB-dependent receptor n=1 Tax=Phenylobacterium sp. Root700 TaxID=1736591 RepID=UPI000B328FE5|nr:TonB-dependent receptor [Phenylobacterium sp. Root700]